MAARVVLVAARVVEVVAAAALGVLPESDDADAAGARASTRPTIAAQATGALRIKRCISRG